jgi:hypothetical protein
MGSKNQHKTVSTIEAAIVAAFEPLHALHNFTNPMGDTGQGNEFPTDRGMEITLDMLANTVYRQLYGNLQGKTGDRFDNIKERLDRAEALMQAHIERYSGRTEELSVDPRTYELDHALRVATTRFECMKELLDGLRNTLEHFTQKKWAPREMTGANSTARKVQITEEMKAAALATINARIARQGAST